MDRKEVIEELKKGFKWEEEFVFHYSGEEIINRIKALDKDKFERIKNLLDENVEDSRRHASMLKEILDKLESGEYEF
ncbi:MAG: hypothetical protein ABIH52_01075 [Candidatus Aenigmatarchaeota archaeon]|nr:hypothetical protein [Nanoarchaeota archaeon]